MNSSLAENTSSFMIFFLGRDSLRWILPWRRKLLVTFYAGFFCRETFIVEGASLKNPRPKPPIGEKCRW